MANTEITKEECTKGLSTRVIGAVMNFHDEVASTNLIAEDLAQGGAKDGTVVISRSQTEGKGRNGRSFSSPKGGLYLSIVLRPPFDPEEASSLPLVIGLAVSKTVNCTIFKEASVKWPNDILVDGKKVAGILMTSKIAGRKLDHIIVGIGINLNTSLEDLPEELQDTAGSLKAMKGEHIDPNEFARDLLYMLDLNYSRFVEGQKEELLEQWSERAVAIGEEVEVTSPKGVKRGKFLGIDQTGALILRNGERMERIDSGDCSLIV